MLQIECDTCKEKFWVKGYSTFDTFTEPGELVIDDKEDFSECCQHIKDGAAYEVVDSSHDDIYDDYDLNDRHSNEYGY